MTSLEPQYRVFWAILLVAGLGVVSPWLWSAPAAPAAAWQGSARFGRLSLDEGLSSSGVTAILQDHHGLLWFATQDGLNRFDGYTFRIYRGDPDDPAALSSSLINCLHEDQTGFLWVGTAQGLCRYDPGTDTFQRFKRGSDVPDSDLHNHVIFIVGDQDGSLWLGTWGGLDRLDPQTGVFAGFSPEAHDLPRIRSTHVRPLLIDSAGRVLLSFYGGAGWLDRATQRMTVVPFPPEPTGVRYQSSVLALLPISADRYLVGTQLGLLLWDRASGLMKPLDDGLPPAESLTRVPIFSSYHRTNGEIWVGTASGLYRFTAGLRLVARYIHNPANPASLASDGVSCIAEDRSGILWFGHPAGGISKLDPTQERFIHIAAAPGDPVHLSHATTWGMAEDRDGNLWVGTSAGLNRLPAGGGPATVFRHDPADSRSLSHDLSQCVLADRSGALWIGTPNGLNRLDPQSGRCQRIKYDDRDPGSLSSNVISSLLEDRSGAVWVGTYNGGLHQLDHQGRVIRRFRHDPADPASLTDDYVISLLADRQGDVWAGTNHGLSRLRPGQTTFTHYRNRPGDPHSLSGDQVYSLFEDSAGRLWIGTMDGLNCLDRRTGRFTRFTVREGLPNNVVYGILEDPAGRLWLSTNRGLARFDPSTRAVRGFDAADGLQSNEFNQYSCLRLRGGSMVFGGINGLTIFNPGEVRDSDFRPPLVLTDFLKFGQSARLPQAVLTATEITLYWKESTFAFEFAALDYTRPSKNHYAYKLEGYDQEWIEVGANRLAGYTNLPGGDYVFRVRGTNSDGLWNAAGHSVRLVIVPPFWQTTWFRISAVLALAVLVNLAYFGGRKLVRTVLAWRRNTYIAHFRTQKVLGRGGMGTGYKALNVVTREIVALKVLNEELADGPSRRRFIQEGLICERIQHPAIVKIFERGEHNGRLYYAMEYIEGCTLRALLDGGPLPPGLALSIFAVVLEILGEIHRAGVVHRDIKPENIMLPRGFDTTGTAHRREPLTWLGQHIKLLDFGVAKSLEGTTATRTGAVTGTVHYIPPEHLSGKRVSEPSFDYYSLGIMLYEMLTGKPAFPGDNPVSVMYGILYETPAPARLVNPEVPDALSAFTTRLILKDPAARLRDFDTIRQETRVLMIEIRPENGQLIKSPPTETHHKPQ